MQPMIQLYPIPTFLRTSMSRVCIQSAPSASCVFPCLAYLGNSRFTHYFLDVISWIPRLSQPLLPLCFLWVGVTAFQTQPLIYLCAHFPLQARVERFWVHLHDASTQYGAWHRVGVINIPWVESNRISSWSGPAWGAVSFSLDLGHSGQDFPSSFPLLSRVREVYSLFQVKQNVLFLFAHLLLVFLLLPSESLPCRLLQHKERRGVESVGAGLSLRPTNYQPYDLWQVPCALQALVSTSKKSRIHGVPLSEAPVRVICKQQHSWWFLLFPRFLSLSFTFWVVASVSSLFQHLSVSISSLSPFLKIKI